MRIGDVVRVEGLVLQGLGRVTGVDGRMVTVDLRGMPFPVAIIEERVRVIAARV